MAETFTNFLVRKTFSTSTSQIIVPRGNGASVAGVQGTRISGSTSQIHSIYVSMEHGSVSTTPENDAVYISLYINDVSNNKYYIGYNVPILPNSSFYIEKTITLLPQQTLNIEYTSLNKISKTINIVSSGVDIY